MKTTNKSTVEFIDRLGTDLTIVNAARVSFDKESEWEDGQGLQLKEQDVKLINYLAKHGHWSPFAHTSIQLRINAPIFVARQLVKHQVGGVWNEVSRRYVDEEPTFYFPEEWRGRPEGSIKQGSSGEVEVMRGSENTNVFIFYEANRVAEVCLDSYQRMLEAGIAPEQARMILPQNMMTSWYWTGSLMFFHRVYKQRTDAHAQLETQEVAHQIGDICSKLFPISWRALNGI